MSSRDVSQVDSNTSSYTQNHESKTQPLKSFGFAIAIIVGFGGLVTSSIGICGLLGVSALSQLGQVNSILMVVIGGGGIPLLVIGIMGSVKTHSIDKIEDHHSITKKEAGPIEQEELKEIQNSFAVFVKELETEIFTFYEAHESTFDKYSIHGRMHVARAVIFGEVMARYFHTHGISVDFSYVRRTIGLHDAGRKNNGIDLWEKESSNLIYKHLISKGMSESEAREKSTIIIKNQCHVQIPEFQLFQSADCLDIMRPCTGHGGKAGFKTEYLTFLKDAASESHDSHFRQQLIEEAWEFIQITEEKKGSDTFKKSEGFMDALFKIIHDHRDQFKILSSII